MKRIHLYAAGMVVALVPAVAGLAGNASFSQSVPVRSPDRSSSVVEHSPTPSPTARPTPDDRASDDRASDDRASDDRGRRGADDGPSHDVADDNTHSGDRSGREVEAGDDHGGRSGSDDSGHHSGGVDDGGSGGHGSDD